MNHYGLDQDLETNTRSKSLTTVPDVVSDIEMNSTAEIVQPLTYKK